MDNQETTPFGYCPRTAFLTVGPHCANARGDKCQDLNSFPLGELEETTGILVLSEWRLSSTTRTWKPITSPWKKQLTWFRIIHYGDQWLQS